MTDKKTSGAKYASQNSDDYADAILNSLGSHVAIIGADGVIVAVNDSWKKFAEQNHGERSAISKGVNYIDVCRKATAAGDPDAEKALKGIRRVLEGKAETFEMEYPCHSPDEKRWFLMRIIPLTDNSGRVLIMHTNITPSMLAARNLESMNKILLHITSSISGLVFQFVRHCDGSYSIPYVSDQVFELTGHSPAEVMNDPGLLFKPIHPDDLDSVVERIEQSAKNLSKFSIEHRLITQRGEERWFNVESTPQLLQNGDVLWNGVSIDITDRKNSEEALKNNQRRFRKLMEQYRAVFENTGSAILIADSESIIEAMNDECERFLRCDRGQIEGKVSWLDFIPEEIRREMKNHHKALLGGRFKGPLRCETTVRTQNGALLDIFLTGAKLPGSSKIIASFVDISERTKVETELRKKTEELEKQSNHLKEVNAALKVVLRQRELDKEELDENVARNIRELISPYIDSLKAGLKNHDSSRLAGIIENNLREIASPFLSKMGLNFHHLSPMEIRVAHLIMEGCGNKEIANIFSISESTVKTHRAKIREKLGLRNKKVNLRSYLRKFNQ